MSPRYPEIQIELASRHPLAMVSAVRHALRHSGVTAGEIHRFTDSALGQEHPEEIRQVCQAWARIDPP